MTRSNEYLRDSDAFSWYMERDPLLRSTIVGVVVLDAAPDPDELMRRVDRASRLAPGFRHKIVEPPLRLANPRWVVDPEFDLSYHCRRIAVAAPGSLDQVFEYARQTGMSGFDKDRPLWEFTLMEGLADGRAALVMKVHHALTDGIGGMEIARFLFDAERDAPATDELPESPPGERLSTLELARDAAMHNARRMCSTAGDIACALPNWVTRAVRHPRATAVELSELVQSIGRIAQPVSTTLSPIMQERRLDWHYDALELPFPALRDAAKTAGVSINDAFLAAVTAGLERYHARFGAAIDELRITMPISLRAPDDPIGGNRITLVRFTLPVGLREMRERMDHVHAAARRAIEEPGIPFSNAIAAALNLMPRAFVGAILKHVDFLASNVPGIPIPIYLCGCEVEAFYAFGPTIGAALNTTLISYNGTCFVGVTVDTGAVTDAEALIEALAAGFADVIGAVNGTAPIRRPRESPVSHQLP